MYNELELYKALNEGSVEEEIAEKYLKEVQSRYDKLNKTKIFNEQSRFINKVNKTLGPQVFNNFVPNYKDLATVAQVFNSSTKIKDKILLERTVVDRIKISKNNISEKMQPVDSVLLKTFSKKFNEKYVGLLSEQKELLTRYINSFGDAKLEFKIYLNEEINRLKTKVVESLEVEEIKKDPDMTNKTVQTLDFLKNFKDIKDITNDTLQKILKIQQFVQEVAR